MEIEGFEPTMARLERVRDGIVSELGPTFWSLELNKVIETLRGLEAIAARLVAPVVPDTAEEAVARMTGGPVEPPAGAHGDPDIPHGEPGHVCGPPPNVFMVELDPIENLAGFEISIHGVTVTGRQALSGLIAAARVFADGEFQAEGMTFRPGVVTE